MTAATPLSRRLASFLPLLLLLAAAGCATTVRSGHDPNFDFSKVHTWRWRIEKGPGGELVDDRARAAIRSELAKKGLRELPPGEGQPDVLVSYAVGSADVLAPDWVFDAAYFGAVVGYVGASSHVTGGILIDMADPATEKGVWAASYIMEGGNANALQVMLDKLEKAVHAAIARYPK
jgi:hypothetical protein